MDTVLQSRLRGLIRRRVLRRLGLELAACWLGTLVLVAGAIWLGSLPRWVAGLVVAAGIAVAIWRIRRRVAGAPNWHRLALELEGAHPELDGRLLTAVQQSEEDGYFQRRLVGEVLLHARRHDWTRLEPGWRVGLSQALNVVLLVALGSVLWLGPPPKRVGGARDSYADGARVTVTPGDTALEKGSTLVIMARFQPPVPASAELVYQASGEAPRRVPLVRSLADPIFGGSVAAVAADAEYRVVFGDEQSPSYRVTVFEYPRLERADAVLTYPEYTGQESRRVEDTRRVSAVEGSVLGLELHLNKPVAEARLVPRGGGGEAWVLLPQATRPLAELGNQLLATSATYDLRLTDVEGRTNTVPWQLVVQVVSNRVPELKLAWPRGDIRPSALEEVRFEASAWDDFGVLAAGLAYTVAESEPVYVELAREVPAREKREMRQVLRLEDLGASPDQFITWFLWADDRGPDGAVRRTMTDLSFAEVRPFDEIFREASGAEPSQGQQSGEQSGGEGNPSARLAELQKENINATWRLRRAASGPGQATDVGVVRDSQVEARAQAEEAAGESEDPRLATFWDTALREMASAVEKLEGATEGGAALAPALASEQAAYQALLRLQAREYEVAQRQNQGRGQNQGRQGQMQRQLDQLDLAQSENRYETESQAQAPQSPERREQLQLQSRLRELAQRQQDVNERLRELQAALQAAETEQEREALRRQLQRLQEQERQMLADVDELQQRLERPENQSRLGEQRERLDQMREDMQRAAEAAAQGSASQALAAGTRAQEQMQEMRDALRRESAGEFAEALRSMRAEARELERRQEAVREQVQSLASAAARSLSDADDRDALMEALATQRERLTNLVTQAREVSEQAEDAEPLVSRELYDTLRQFSQDDAGVVKAFQEELIDRGLMTQSLYDTLQETRQRDAQALELTAEMVRRGYVPQSRQAEEEARAGIGELARGMERAAERVLGDDTSALRQAEQALNELTQALEQEMAQAGQEPGQEPGPGGREAQPGSDRGSPAESDRTGEQAAAASTAATPGQTPGEEGQRQGERGAGQPAGGDPAAGRASPEEDTQVGGAGALVQRLFQPGRTGAGPSGTGPITGEAFGPWSDRLREVEEMVEMPSLRNELAQARDQARRLRQAYREQREKPDWAVVRLEVADRLVEVRGELVDELARRGARDSLVPIDRDPVPGRYADLVERYYERLGRESP